MKISVFSPVKNESQFIGYSIMAVLPYVHELIYACAPSSDGTDELLDSIKAKYAGDKLKILRRPEYDFNVHDMKAYNQSFNDCIETSTGDALWFLHPDMIVTNPEKIADIKDGPLAWWTNLTSYAKDYDTKITVGRAARWKNIHAKKLGLHYYGGYGSQNEDMYHKAITNDSHVHYGEDFLKYPYRVINSNINIAHYCEMKGYKRRYEKMKSCLETLYPKATPQDVEYMATHHPRVTLEAGNSAFGKFSFEKTDEPVPEVFLKYRDEFEQFTKVPGEKLIA